MRGAELLGLFSVDMEPRAGASGAVDRVQDEAVARASVIEHYDSIMIRLQESLGVCSLAAHQAGVESAVSVCISSVLVRRASAGEVEQGARHYCDALRIAPMERLRGGTQTGVLGVENSHAAPWRPASAPSSASDAAETGLQR